MAHRDGEGGAQDVTAPQAPPLAVLEPRLPERYVILGRIGEGGMGVVYTAYDRELDRKVAVKLLRGEHDAAGQARLAREAQALAKLQHPNVVAVYDVGRSGQRVFLTMELVEGRSLRDWLADARPWREVLQLFLAAGSGLAAAHAAGLVHRDFKPDNVLVGDDGRVRVSDFGLARLVGEPQAGGAPSPSSPALAANLTRSGTVLGTPRYMAPEQRVGEADARSDQFSFCVALHEALFREHPFNGDQRVPAPARTAVPGHVRAAVAVGLSRTPAERFADMAALLGELARDPSARRRRLALIAGAAATIVAMLGAGIFIQERRQRRCDGAEQKLAGVWDDGRRAAMRAAFLATGKPWAAAAAARAGERLDEMARALVASHTEACQARVRGEQSPEVEDTRMACIDDRLGQLRAVTDLFVAADEEIVTRSDQALNGIADVRDCADPSTWSAAMRLPREPDLRARIGAVNQQMDLGLALLAVGRRPAALPLLEGAAGQADALAHPPLRARAAFNVGKLRLDAGDNTGAAASFFAAMLAAQTVGNDRGVAMAAAEMARCTEGTSQFEEGRRWAELARAVAHRIHDEREVVHAELALGEVEFAAGRYREAERVDRLALERTERLDGPDGRDAIAAVHALGVVAAQRRDHAASVDWLRRAVGTTERTLGPDHPTMAAALGNLGLALHEAGGYQEARVTLARALAITVAARGGEHPNVAKILTSLAMVERALDLSGDALEHNRRARDIVARAPGVQRWGVFVTSAGLAEALLADGRLEDARREFEHAVALQKELVGDDHATWPETLEGLARLERAAGHPDVARQSLVRGIGFIDKYDGADSPRLVSMLMALGDLELTEAHPAQARDAAARAVAVAAKNDIRDQPDLIAAEVTLGRALLALGDAAAAVAPLEAARDALLRRPAQNRSERTQAERGRLALAEAKAALR